MKNKKYYAKSHDDNLHLVYGKKARLSAIAILVICTLPPDAWARDYFNPESIELRDGASVASLDDFSETGGQAPGIYRVEIYLNGNIIEKRDVKFDLEEGKLYPEITLEQYKAMGVLTDAFPALAKMPKENVITNPEKYIPDAEARFNFSQQRLDISVPQSVLSSQARGYVDPSQWDQGVPALLVNYSYTGSQSEDRHNGRTDNANFLSLQSGLNFGPWRLRNYSTWSDAAGSSSWNNVYTYMQRDIQALRGQLTAGESNTPGDVFDSVQFRGVQLASDDNQLPDSLRGFAPVIRGIAQSNAQVTIRQNGYIIYQTYVTPGPFAITDLYPTGSQGNLEVTVREADGREQRFVQPFSSVPIMQREGQLKYAVTAGKYRSSISGAKEPVFARLTAIYGLPKDTTVYGGITGSADYQSGVVGIGHGFGDIGSVSADVTQARAVLPDDSTEQGQSYRIQYSKDIASSGTNFTLAGYRYSTSGYYDFQEANDYLSGNSLYYSGHKRSRTQLNVNQSMGEAGSFYISGYQQDFWNRDGTERNLSAGYGLSRWGVSWNLSYSWTRPAGGGENNQLLAFSMQVPLDRFLSNTWASYSLSSSKHGQTSQQMGLSGTALENNNLSYTLNQGYSNKGGGGTSYATADYKGTYGELNAGYNYSSNSRQLNYGVSGGVVAHEHGVTLSQPLGDTIALVRAPGAAGVGVENHTGVKTDWRGYAVVPYLSTYRRNRVALDTQTMADDVDIDDKVRNVVPTQGAVVLADFKTRVGSRVLMTLMFEGKPIPFGALVTLLADDSTDPTTGIASNNGDVYLSGVQSKGSVTAKWGNGAREQCRGQFSLSNDANKKDLQMLTVVCQ